MITITLGRTSFVSFISDEDEALLAHPWWYQKANYGGGGYAYWRPSSAPIRPRTWLHRAVMARMEGRPLDRIEQVDHIDGNKLNNQRENLRIAFHGQQQANVNLRKDNKSGVKGVHWEKNTKSWRASIRVNYKLIDLGYHKELSDAKAAYDAAALLYFKEFANDGTGNMYLKQKQKKSE